MKFVDLVREYTSSVGLADIVLDGVVQGFNTFAESYATGDEFYYSIIGLDHPTEKEVGTGTFQADGSFTRAPVDAPTNFSPGVKTVAAVVGAAWFGDTDTALGLVQAFMAGVSPYGADLVSAADAPGAQDLLDLPGSYAAIVGTRAQLAALPTDRGVAQLREGNRQGVFSWSGANLATQVAADTQQGLLVAPVADPTGATGAWVRQYSGPASFLWFGAVADCVAAGAGTTNTAVFDAARAALIACGKGWLHVPQQRAGYRLATAPAQITDGILLTGEGWHENAGTVAGVAYVGIQQYPGTVFCTDADVPALKFVAATDNASNAVDWEFQSSTRSVVRDLMFYSPGGVGIDAHGIETFVKITLTNVRIEGFAGSGVKVRGDDVGSSANQYGNAAQCFFSQVSCRGNKLHGFDIAGNNSSVINFLDCDSANNGGAAYLDNGPFGNYYAGCHMATNNASFGTPAGFSAAQRAKVLADWPALSDVTAGGIYCPGGVATTVFNACYGELFGVGVKSHMSLTCVVVGGNLATDLAHLSTSVPGRINSNHLWGFDDIKAGSSGILALIKGMFDITESVGYVGPATGARLQYNSTNGLAITGVGSVYDVGIRNAAGVSVLLVPHNGTTLQIPGGLAVTGTVTASNLSNTNTGDETQTTILTKLGTNAIALNKLSNAAAASIVGATAAGAHSDLTPAQAKTVLAIASGDVSGLTYFATGTDAANLTGTIAAGRLPAFTGGDVTSSVGSIVLTIGANKVTRGMLANTAAAAILGATAAGAVSDLTPTVVTSMLNVATTALKGLVPAPGTATGLFLRDDMTWAAGGGGGSPGGADRQLQYNNAAAFGGAAAVDVDADGALRFDTVTPTATPGANQFAFTPQCVALGSGALWPRFKGEDGIFQSLQSSFGRNSIDMLVPNRVSNSYVVNTYASATEGTLTTRVPSSTNRATRSKRVGHASAAGAGSKGSWYCNNANFLTIGGASGAGFRAVFRWVESDPATVATAHMFIGVKSDIAAPSATANPNTYTNCIGVAQLAGAANLQIVYGGSAAQTPIDLGANFPAAGHSTDLYELILYARPDDATKVSYRVERVGTAFFASGVLTGTAGVALPAVTTFLSPRAFRTNNTTALAVGLDICGIYTENDI